MSDIFYTDAETASFAVVESGVHNTTWTGAWNAPPQTNNLLFRKIGPVVILHFPAFTSAADVSTTIKISTVLPVSIRPTRPFTENMRVFNGPATTGVVELATNGNVTLFGNVTLGNFTMGLDIGFDATTLTYFID